MPQPCSAAKLVGPGMELSQAQGAATCRSNAKASLTARKKGRQGGQSQRKSCSVCVGWAGLVLTFDRRETCLILYVHSFSSSQKEPNANGSNQKDRKG